MNKLTIGRVAQASGVGIETVRFYERKGLIEQPIAKSSFRVSAGGHRTNPVYQTSTGTGVHSRRSGTVAGFCRQAFVIKARGQRASWP